MPREKRKRSAHSQSDSRFGVGLAIGIAIGVAMDNLAMGVALGMVFGFRMSKPENQAKRSSNMVAHDED